MLGIVTVDDAIDAIIPERLTKKLPRFTKRGQRRRAEAATWRVPAVRLSRRSIFAFFAVLGPGFITASAGNDVGGIATYSAAGAKFGYATLWTLVALTVSLIVVQEMAGRMGAVTGQGLAGLIRENFGLRTTFFAMVALFFVNTGITATEFAGIAAASEIFRVSHYIAVPLATVVVFCSCCDCPTGSSNGSSSSSR